MKEKNKSFATKKRDLLGRLKMLFFLSMVFTLTFLTVASPPKDREYTLVLALWKELDFSLLFSMGVGILAVILEVAAKKEKFYNESQK